MAIDIGSVAAMSTSLQTAGEILKAMVGLRDGVMMQGKIAELQTVILAAQSAALAANVSQFALLDRVRELEKEITDMKAWDAEKQKYELKEISAGVFAYVLKCETEPCGPQHWLCTTCYQYGRKSFLQFRSIPKTGREDIFGCDGCKSQVLVDWTRAPISGR